MHDVALSQHVADADVISCHIGCTIGTVERRTPVDVHCIHKVDCGMLEGPPMIL
jgi:hypothetical protein